MKVLVIGGIYDKDSVFRASLQATPETTLEAGLRKRGCTVDVAGHRTWPVVIDSYDVVHVHHFGRAALRVATAESRTPFVFTSHDGPGLCGLPRNLIPSTANHIIMRCADAVVALSDAERHYQKQHYAVSATVHAVIPNGIDSSIYHCPQEGGPRRSANKVILFVGQLISLKRVDVLLRALRLLDEVVCLRLAYHVNQLESRLRELAFELGVERRVEFLGPKEPAELRDLYRSADVLCLPSEAESQPSVVSEALLCGVPIVASDLPGIREHAGEFADLVPPGDVEALAEALKRALIRDSQRDARIEAGRKYAIARYSIDAMVERHIEVYEAAMRAATVRKQNRTVPRALRLLAGTGLRLL